MKLLWTWRIKRSTSASKDEFLQSSFTLLLKEKRETFIILSLTLQQRCKEERLFILKRSKIFYYKTGFFIYGWYEVEEN